MILVSNYRRFEDAWHRVSPTMAAMLCALLKIPDPTVSNWDWHYFHTAIIGSGYIFDFIDGREDFSGEG